MIIFYSIMILWTCFLWVVALHQNHPAWVVAAFWMIYSIIQLALAIKKKRKEKQEQKRELGKPYPGNCRCTIIPMPMDVCDSCGKNPKAQNSQICQECQDKVYERYKGWF